MLLHLAIDFWFVFFFNDEKPNFRLFFFVNVSYSIPLTQLIDQTYFQREKYHFSIEIMDVIYNGCRQVGRKRIFLPHIFHFLRTSQIQSRNRIEIMHTN